MVVNSVLIGKAKGSIGNITFGGWKGRTVGRTKPTDVSNPNTSGQQNQRSKFRAIVDLYKQLKAVVTVGFKSFSGSITEYNAFVKSNISDLFTNAVGSPLAYDWNNLLIAKGPILSTPAEMNYGANAITFVYSDQADELNGQSVSDVPAYAVINATGDVLYTGIADAAIRQDGEFSITVSGISSLSGLKGYLFFISPDFSKCSTSVVVTNS